ncbi:MAG: DUF72 domain-containing protein [Fervidicoccus fontis]|nr:MAG: DUF72 domain-containing protein [Fervidicoccus fontis]
MARILIGVCGFPKSLSTVFSSMDIVEIQQSFYEPLSQRRIESLRKSNKYNREISLKVWQVVTHPPQSPTWKKMKKKPEGELSNYGYLKPTEENLKALNLSLSQAKELNAFAAVLQTPPSMPYNVGHLENILEFFRQAIEMSEKMGVFLIWEPRGAYAEDIKFLGKVAETGVIICSDFLRRGVLVEGDIMYTRLHGLGEKEVNYNYKYKDEDLARLKKIIFEHLSGERKIYVLFNNVHMFDDAVRFKKIIGELA